MIKQRAGHRRANRAADENAGHVQGVEPAAAGGIQCIDGSLAQHHAGLHAEIQHHARYRKAYHAVGRMNKARKKAQCTEQKCAQRRDAGVTGVCQTPADGGRNGTDCADQGKDRDLGLRQPVIA